MLSGAVRRMPASAIDRSHDNGQRTCCSIFSSSSGRVRGRFGLCASIVGDSDNFYGVLLRLHIYTACIIMVSLHNHLYN